MKNIYKIGFLYTLTSLLLTYIILGSSNILPTSNDWMLHGDAAQSLIIWKYFFNDVWRFPIGLNPNYGSRSRKFNNLFRDPYLFYQFFFKLIKNILPDNFHHFSIWIFLMFFIAISFFIFTNKKIYQR